MIENGAGSFLLLKGGNVRNFLSNLINVKEIRKKSVKFWIWNFHLNLILFYQWQSTFEINLINSFLTKWPKKKFFKYLMTKKSKWSRTKRTKKIIFQLNFITSHLVSHNLMKFSSPFSHHHLKSHHNAHTKRRDSYYFCSSSSCFYCSLRYYDANFPPAPFFTGAKCKF